MFITKLTTAKNLYKGQRVYGVRDSGFSSAFSATVDAVTPAGVRLLVWDKSPEMFSIDAEYEVKLNDEEIKKEFRKDAEIVYRALQNELREDEIGEHTCSNVWISNNIYEMAYQLKKRNLKLVGVSYDILEKHGLIGNYDTGVCAEFPDGRRVWCHTKSDVVREMLDYYRKDFVQ